MQKFITTAQTQGVIKSNQVKKKKKTNKKKQENKGYDE